MGGRSENNEVEMEGKGCMIRRRGGDGLRVGYGTLRVYVSI